MAERKKRTLEIKLKAQDQILKGLVNNQEISDKVLGIRTILIDKHTAAMNKRSDARLARLIETGTDRPTPTPPENDQAGPSTPGVNTQRQVFPKKRAQGGQRTHKGPPRTPTNQQKGQSVKKPRMTPQQGQSQYNYQPPSSRFQCKIHGTSCHLGHQCGTPHPKWDHKWPTPLHYFHQEDHQKEPGAETKEENSHPLPPGGSRSSKSTKQLSIYRH